MVDRLQIKNQIDHLFEFGMFKVALLREQISVIRSSVFEEMALLVGKLKSFLAKREGVNVEDIVFNYNSPKDRKRLVGHFFPVFQGDSSTAAQEADCCAASLKRLLSLEAVRRYLDGAKDADNFLESRLDVNNILQTKLNWVSNKAYLTAVVNMPSVVRSITVPDHPGDKFVAFNIQDAELVTLATLSGDVKLADDLSNEVFWLRISGNFGATPETIPYFREAVRSIVHSFLPESIPDMVINLTEGMFFDLFVAKYPVACGYLRKRLEEKKVSESSSGEEIHISLEVQQVLSDYVLSCVTRLCARGYKVAFFDISGYIVISFPSSDSVVGKDFQDVFSFAGAVVFGENPYKLVKFGEGMNLREAIENVCLKV